MGQRAGVAIQKGGRIGQGFNSTTRPRQTGQQIQMGSGQAKINRQKSTEMLTQSSKKYDDGELGNYNTYQRDR